MWKLNCRAYVPFAVIAVAGLAGIAPADARGERPREGQEQRHPAAQRPGARPEAERRQSYHTQPARMQSVHAAPRPQVSYAQHHPAADNHRQVAVRSSGEQRRPTDVSFGRESHIAGGGRVNAPARDFSVGQVHVVRYGNSVSGMVERPIRPGFVSRTFVSGGHVLYTHVYQRHVWYHYGTAFAYETFVPAVRYPAVYYGWALAAWPRPVVYAWGWQVQPWYPAYGYLFTPYPVYTSPDLWMTDYIIAHNMQAAYQAQAAVPTPQPSPQETPPAPAPDASVAPYAAEPADTSTAQQPSDARPALQSSEAPPASQPSDASSAPVAPPPVITSQIKAQLNAQIKVQLQEQQAAAATPAVLTTESTPPALRPNHVFFQVVQRLDVPSATPNGHCSLSANDYVKRTGGMSDDDWKIPVVVELSRPFDCPEGLQTRIALNDLNAMENEQEAQVLEAMQAASKSMGPNGPPKGPGLHPTLIADGSATPDPGALEAIQHAQ